MAYVKDWSRLNDALNQVMKATGVTEGDAKHDICGALADRKIRIRLTLQARPERMFFAGVRPIDPSIPRHLNPDDFEWSKSRPRRPWPPERVWQDPLFTPSEWQAKWRVLWLELQTVDVISVLCTAPGKKAQPEPRMAVPDEKASPKADTSKRVRRYPKRERAQLAIKELYPTGVPDPVKVSDKELCRAVARHLQKHSPEPAPANDTILRAARRRK